MHHRRQCAPQGPREAGAFEDHANCLNPLFDGQEGDTDKSADRMES